MAEKTESKTCKFIASHKAPITIVSLSAIIICGALLWLVSYTKAHSASIYPGISVASIDIGGLTPTAATQKLQLQMNELLESGLAVTYISSSDGAEHMASVPLQASGASDPDLIQDFITLDANAASNAAVGYAKGGSAVNNAIFAIKAGIFGHNITPQFTINKNELTEELKLVVAEEETESTPTDYKINITNEITIQVVEGVVGKSLEVESALKNLQIDLKDLSLDTLNLELVPSLDLVSTSEAESLTNEVTSIINAGPYTFTYENESWTISKEQISDWIIPAKENDTTIITLEDEILTDILESMHETIDITPTNARFAMINGKVNEFAASSPGLSVNDEANISLLTDTLGNTESNLIVQTIVEEPDVTTSSVNNLGITEILGVGQSDFSGSPYNRVQNIKNGASKLNGLLIAPDETLSLVETLKPFTLSGGYLPELVIKGDEIIPEIGGGLCQIGTTTFRASMNSGLEIVERRNHSLVVNYYNDPSNNNPGTDATIYDPAPDFKVKNDTENYILLTTDVDTTTYLLTFTFYGTSDGRIGSYTPPEIFFFYW